MAVGTAPVAVGESATFSERGGTRPGWWVLEGQRKQGMVHCSLMLFRTTMYLRVAGEHTGVQLAPHVSISSLNQ